MNATLPHGLITIGHADRRNDNSTHYADVLFERSNILHQFWKGEHLWFSTINLVSKVKTQFMPFNIE